jgi:putative transposase
MERKSAKGTLEPLQQVFYGITVGFEPAAKERQTMPFRVCYYHVVWATKNREPLIVPEVEAVVLPAVVRKSTELDSPVLAINSAGDHVHVAVSISTRISVAEWVKNVKGFSAHEVNAILPQLGTPFHWQKGYGVLTFGTKALPLVSDYIARQKEHHSDNTLDLYLERIEE